MGALEEKVPGTCDTMVLDILHILRGVVICLR